MLPSWGTIQELREVVAMARAGAIHTEIEAISLDGVVKGYHRLKRGEVLGRVVADPAA